MFDPSIPTGGIFKQAETSSYWDTGRRDVAALKGNSWLSLFV